MNLNYPLWLNDQKYADNTQTAQLHRVRKVEEYYGDLDEHFKNNTLNEVIENLQYSVADERGNKPNPSKIIFDGNIRNNLQSYKNAVVRYRKYLHDDNFQSNINELKNTIIDDDDVNTYEEESLQRFALERDMQANLRRNIKSLDACLEIIDDGAERSVNSGLIDITCQDEDSLVVVELKAGKADSRSIGQILGYMGDLLQDEENQRQVRGILVAHDFDKRARAAARVVPTLLLKKYSIEFQFITEE